MKTSIFVLSFALLSGQIMAANTSRIAITKRALRTNGSVVSNTSSTDTENKTKAECEQFFYDCMDKKTNETVTKNELYYDDYNDMITEIYSGMSSPAFKCIYSNNIKDLYETYYYNQTGLDSSNSNAKIKKNSIEYYAFLKQNANDVATKKITANMVHPEVLTIANISVSPVEATPQPIPNVSYKFTTLDPSTSFELNKQYCFDPEQNKNLNGCPKLRKSLADDWKNLPSNTLTKSCQDYETFLIEKRSKALQTTQTFILSLKTQITNAINEYNSKIEASKELFDK